MSNTELSDIALRLSNLADGLKSSLKGIPVDVITEGNDVLVRFQELLICGACVEEEIYRIYNASGDWAQKTTYYCEENDDGTWQYYLETIEECIGEITRLVMFEARKGQSRPDTNRVKSSSELEKIVTPEAFERAYRNFIIQADKNAISKKSFGGKEPLGFEGLTRLDGKDFHQHFGSGGASTSPYISWYVVSIYYIPTSGKITIAIEKNRYTRVKKMNPLKYEIIGRKTEECAVFYTTNKRNVDYRELHENFMRVCKKVLELGLDD